MSRGLVGGNRRSGGGCKSKSWGGPLKKMPYRAEGKRTFASDYSSQCCRIAWEEFRRCKRAKNIKGELYGRYRAVIMHIVREGKHPSTYLKDAFQENGHWGGGAVVDKVQVIRNIGDAIAEEFDSMVEDALAEMSFTVQELLDVDWVPVEVYDVAARAVVLMAVYASKANLKMFGMLPMHDWQNPPKQPNARLPEFEKPSKW